MQEPELNLLHHAIDAIDALEKRAPISHLRDYLAWAAAEHRDNIRHLPNNKKVAALALCGLLDRLHDVFDDEGSSTCFIKEIGYRRKARPRTANSPAAEREAARKRKGLFEYEKLLSKGEEPKNALSDAAAVAGMAERHFERILEARRALCDLDHLQEYVSRGPEEAMLAKAAAQARWTHTGVEPPALLVSGGVAVGARHYAQK